MKRFLLAASLAIVASIAGSSDASAQFSGGNLGFAPFGFYQPFGAQFSTSIRTPPYFATNPPVYYGARYARPYGLSPFAAPPQLQAGADYRGRLGTDFLEPAQPTPGYVPRYDIPAPAPLCNPYIHGSTTSQTNEKIGKIQTNPFVEPTERIAKTDAKNEA